MTRLIALNDRFWLPLTLVAVLAIATVSLTPLPELPLPDLQGEDKLGHLLAYAGLTVPSAVARPARWPLWIAGFLVFGAAIELAQPYANRHGELRDWLANATGIALGFLAGTALRGVRR